jgi:predicted RNA binding protein YcfA (HicA-like mRNA interferase family)
MNLSPRYLIQVLERHGFIYKRAKGSHKIYYNPVSNKTVVVPEHGGKDMKKGTFLAILKQADIDFENL